MVVANGKVIAGASVVVVGDNVVVGASVVVVGARVVVVGASVVGVGSDVVVEMMRLSVIGAGPFLMTILFKATVLVGLFCA